MFFLRRIVYFMRKAVGSIRENPFINLITVGTIAIAMLLEGSFLLVFSNLNAVVDRLTRDVEISAYLHDDASQAIVASLGDRLKRLPEVEDVRFVSKAEALEVFQRQNPEDKALLDELGENPLPASYQVKLAPGYRDAESVTRIAADLAADGSVEEVEYGQEWIAKFTAFLKLLQIAGIGLGVMLVLAVVFVVSNTIKLAVFARRDELEIMQLVGATPMFIRIPYLLEGILQGGAGSLLAVAGLWLGWRTASVHATASLAPVFGTSRLEFLPTDQILALVLGGVLLGFFGSLFAMGRFLRSAPR
jgi:cell division transport system permease protein